MSYPGGKGGAGVYQTLINLMPPHRVYVEPFLGGGSVMRAKRPASCSIGVDADAQVLTAWDGDGIPGLRLVHGDALEFLASYPWVGDELVYADPPYLGETRASSRPIYRHEMQAEEEHAELLELLLSLPCMVMVSGYASDLYARKLSGWRVETFQAMTRAGRMATESVWLNFSPPLELHDYRYLGSDYRERERIKRKRERWRAKLAAMPPLERYAILAALEEVRSTSAGNGGARGRTIDDTAAPGGTSRKSDARSPTASADDARRRRASAGTGTGGGGARGRSRREKRGELEARGGA